MQPSETITDDRLAEIQQRADAATAGQWRWRGNTDVKHIYLVSDAEHRPIVMNFARYGMSEAAPQFRDEWRMQRADEIAVYEVAPAATSRNDDRVYRADIVGFRNPDAEFIAHAREDVPWLLAEVVSLRGKLTAATEYATKIIEANTAPGNANAGDSAALRAGLARRFLAALQLPSELTR